MQAKIPVIPTVRPIIKSKMIPNIKPKTTPIFLPANNPTNSTNIINKFGLIFAIVNHEKKLACKKYTIKKVIIIPTIVIVFFNLYPPFNL